MAILRIMWELMMTGNRGCLFLILRKKQGLEKEQAGIQSREQTERFIGWGESYQEEQLHEDWQEFWLADKPYSPVANSQPSIRESVSVSHPVVDSPSRK